MQNTRLICLLAFLISVADSFHQTLCPNKIFKSNYCGPDLCADLQLFRGSGQLQATKKNSQLWMSAGTGFGQPKRRLNLQYGGSTGDPVVQREKWEVAYKAFISRMGKYLTAMSWEGYKRLGKGAIYANIQARQPVKRGQILQKWQKFGGIPTMYVAKEQYQVKNAQTDQELNDLQQIVSRIESYDAEREFVIVFEAAGLMGADVVRPSIKPPEMHKILGDEDGYGIQKDEETSIDSLADYWRNHGSNVKADEIDMTSLIFDALEKENSVVDITEHIEKIIDGEV